MLTQILFLPQPRTGCSCNPLTPNEVMICAIIIGVVVLVLLPLWVEIAQGIWEMWGDLVYKIKKWGRKWK